MMNNWEDFLYNAQSSATSLASFGLENDPSNLLTSLPILYLAGLLTSFSPCVWGLLPLTMSYISNAAGERTDQRTLVPTLSFAAGLAVVFCSLGVAAAELGGIFGGGGGGGGGSGMVLPILSNGICLVMGLKLLDLVDIPLPSFEFLNLDNKRRPQTDAPVLLDATGKILEPNKSESDERGSLFRTFLLGGSSALVASPCATPVLTSILAFVAKASNPLLGGILLLFYTLGYSTPLLIVAASGGQALVELRNNNSYAKIGTWVTPITGGILLYSAVMGVLTTIIGDPSLAGLAFS